MLVSVFAAVAGAALQPAGEQRDWRGYGVVESVGSSILSFDASRLERSGASVRVWTQSLLHYSGRNSSTVEERHELDCAARTVRGLERVERDPAIGQRAPRRTLREPARPIAAGSNHVFLAGRLCNGAEPAEIGAIAWLNLPDAEGPATRFSFDTAPRQAAGKFQFWLRYQTIGAALPVSTEARLEVDCAARTQRTLERIVQTSPSRAEHVVTPDAAPAPIVRSTRESVLAYLHCPAFGPA